MADIQSAPLKDTPLRVPAETEFAEEFEAIRRTDERQRPPNWRMSPWGVATYILGGTLADGFTLITILSEKSLPVPELNAEVRATRGFNIIATANNRDRGVNELSSALKRRFNTVILPVPATLDEEVSIVSRRVAELGKALEIPAEEPALAEVRRLVTLFRELRSGVTEDGKTKLKTPSSSLSTAEAISVVNSGLALAAHFGDGRLTASDLAAGLHGAIVKDPVQDGVAWREYLETVAKERDGWRDLYRACRDLTK